VVKHQFRLGSVHASSKTAIKSIKTAAVMFPELCSSEIPESQKQSKDWQSTAFYQFNSVSFDASHLRKNIKCSFVFCKSKLLGLFQGTVQFVLPKITTISMHVSSHLVLSPQVVPVTLL
jgi:hypothetical protein